MNINPIKRSGFFLIALCLGIASCDIKPDGPAELSNEEHAILTVVLDSIMHEIYPLTTIDVYDQTSMETRCASLQIALERDSISYGMLLNNYANANRTKYALDMDRLPVYVMLKDTEESDLFSGYLAFTRPGISDDGLMAVVEYGAQSSPISGYGYGIVLEKQDDNWVVVWRKLMSIS